MIISSLRNRTIAFAVLFTLRPDGAIHGYILRRQGRYYLVDPTRAAGDGALDREGLTELGTSIAEAVQNLPNLLANEPTKYMPYRQILQAVHEGIAPQVLAEIVLIPVNWRRDAEELRRLFTSHLGQPERELLSDFETSYRGLHKELEELNSELQQKQAQRQALGKEAAASFSGIEQKEGRQALTQSLAILDAFTTQWRQMEEPSETTSAMPDAFRVLFAPLGEHELKQRLSRLRQAFLPSENIFRAVIHAEADGGFWAEVPDLPGCFTQGSTLDEVYRNLNEAIACHLNLEVAMVRVEVLEMAGGPSSEARHASA